MTLPLQQGITYGPVRSRRLGRSLGINILPAKKKTCTFNCVYCHYGWTTYECLEELKDVCWPTPDMVHGAVKRTLSELFPPPSYITFSGNGEPALHPKFDEIVDCVIDLRNKLSPLSRTAILSNSTPMTDEKVRRAVERLDLRVLKLDAGNLEVYHTYNCPLCRTDLDELVAALQSTKEVTIQTLFAAGPSGNSHPLHVNDWLTKVVQISPVHVQLYTLDRPYPSKNISPVNRDQLEGIKARLERYGINARVY